MITKDECDIQVWKKFTRQGISVKNLVKTKVEVRSFNIDWLLNDRKNFLQFSVVLAKCKTQ